jgi:hypothetical protein
MSVKFYPCGAAVSPAADLPDACPIHGDECTVDAEHDAAVKAYAENVLLPTMQAEAEAKAASETILVRHDDTEASLPHQVELPAESGIVLPDPVGFEVELPKWVPMDEPSMIALHWWASLATHLNVMLRVFKAEPGVDNHRAVYQLDKAVRYTGQIIRKTLGTVVNGAVQAAAVKAAEEAVDLNAGVGEHTELAAWTMILQTAFGIACVQAVGHGAQSDLAQETKEVYEWSRSAFESRIQDANVAKIVVTICTGTNTGTVEEKMEQWSQAVARAAEGLPDGAIPGLEEALPKFIDIQGEDGTIQRVPFKLLEGEEAQAALREAEAAVSFKLDAQGMADVQKLFQEALRPFVGRPVSAELRAEMLEAVKHVVDSLPPLVTIESIESRGTSVEVRLTDDTLFHLHFVDEQADNEGPEAAV